MTAKERGIGIRMPGLAIGSLEVRGVAVEALRDELVVISAPVLLAVVQQAHLEVDLLSRADLELFRCAALQHDVASEGVAGREGGGRFHSHGLLEAHHSVLKTLLNLLVAASVTKLRLVDVVALGVPSVEGQMLIDLTPQFILDMTVLVHVQVLNKVVDADLGGVYRGQINN